MNPAAPKNPNPGGLDPALLNKLKQQMQNGDSAKQDAPSMIDSIISPILNFLFLVDGTEVGPDGKLVDNRIKNLLKLIDQTKKMREYQRQREENDPSFYSVDVARDIAGYDSKIDTNNPMYQAMEKQMLGSLEIFNLAQSLFANVLLKEKDLPEQYRLNQGNLMQSGLKAGALLFAFIPGGEIFLAGIMAIYDIYTKSQETNIKKVKTYKQLAYEISEAVSKSVGMKQLQTLSNMPPFKDDIESIEMAAQNCSRGFETAFLQKYLNNKDIIQAMSLMGVEQAVIGKLQNKTQDYLDLDKQIFQNLITKDDEKRNEINQERFKENSFIIKKEFIRMLKNINVSDLIKQLENNLPFILENCKDNNALLVQNIIDKLKKFQEDFKDESIISLQYKLQYKALLKELYDVKLKNVDNNNDIPNASALQIAAFIQNEEYLYQNLLEGFVFHAASTNQGHNAIHGGSGVRKIICHPYQERDGNQTIGFSSNGTVVIGGQRNLIHELAHESNSVIHAAHQQYLQLSKDEKQKHIDFYTSYTSYQSYLEKVYSKLEKEYLSKIQEVGSEKNANFDIAKAKKIIEENKIVNDFELEKFLDYVGLEFSAEMKQTQNLYSNDNDFMEYNKIIEEKCDEKKNTQTRITEITKQIENIKADNSLSDSISQINKLEAELKNAKNPQEQDRINRRIASVKTKLYSQPKGVELGNLEKELESKNDKLKEIEEQIKDTTELPENKDKNKIMLEKSLEDVLKNAILGGDYYKYDKMSKKLTKDRINYYQIKDPFQKISMILNYKELSMNVIQFFEKKYQITLTDVQKKEIRGYVKKSCESIRRNVSNIRKDNRVKDVYKLFHKVHTQAELYPTEEHREEKQVRTLENMEKFTEEQRAKLIDLSKDVNIKSLKMKAEYGFVVEHSHKDEVNPQLQYNSKLDIQKLDKKTDIKDKVKNNKQKIANIKDFHPSQEVPDGVDPNFIVNVQNVQEKAMQDQKSQNQKEQKASLEEKNKLTSNQQKVDTKEESNKENIKKIKEINPKSDLTKDEHFNQYLLQQFTQQENEKVR